MPLYSCFDFILNSDFPLAELAEAESEGPVVRVRLGEAPETLSGVSGGGLEVAGEDALLTVEGVARYLVRGGREILVEPAPHGSERNVRLFLLGSALGILCHQRGLMPLHANAVVCGGNAFAFAGPSGAGKSTLAAWFARMGYPVLCDDVCAVSFGADGAPLAWPGLPRLKLWGDAAEAFGHERAGLERALEGFDKYHVPLPAAAVRPAPLRRLYVLTKGDTAGFRRLRGQEAMSALFEQTYRGLYLQPLGLAPQNFRHAAALLAQAEVWEARRGWGYDVFEREAGAIERHIRCADAAEAPNRRAS